MLICNKCGKTGKRGKFCVYCGGELSEFFTIKAEAPDASPKGECPDCGKTFAEGKFCIFCGTALKPIGGAEENTSGFMSEAAFTQPAPEPVAAPVAEPAPAPVQSEPAKLQCVECGKIHDRGKFCTACGGTLKPVGEAAEQPAPMPVAPPVAEPAPVQSEPAKLQCVECGKIHNRGKFCTACGGTLKPVGEAAEQSAPMPVAAPVPEPAPVQSEPAKLQCVECGKIHDRGKFCTACGGTLKPMGEAAEQPAPMPVAATVPEPAPVQSEPAKLQCVECGKIHDRGKFCTACGGTLKPMGEAAEQPAPMPVAAPVPEPAPVQTEAPAAPASEPAKLQCVECGKIHDRGKFCTACGGNLQPMGSQTAPAPAEVQQPAGLICPSCGKTFESGKFCTVCGSTLVPQNAQPAPAATANDGLLHCSQCGKTFERGKFCTVCGGKLVTSDMLNV